MHRFSPYSLRKLYSCHRELQEVAKEAIGYVDFRVISGYRTKEEQNKAFGEGFSKLKWPKSSHNKQPSNAFDLVPWPLDWEDRERFFFLAGTILAVAKRRGIELCWGGAWTGEFNLEKSWDDLAHFERMEKDVSSR